jgi:hypothetical protein
MPVMMGSVPLFCCNCFSRDFTPRDAYKRKLTLIHYNSFTNPPFSNANSLKTALNLELRHNKLVTMEM